MWILIPRPYGYWISKSVPQSGFLHFNICPTWFWCKEHACPWPLLGAPRLYLPNLYPPRGEKGWLCCSLLHSQLLVWKLAHARYLMHLAMVVPSSLKWSERTVLACSHGLKCRSSAYKTLGGGWCRAGKSCYHPSHGAWPGVGTRAMQASGEGHWENDWSSIRRAGLWSECFLSGLTVHSLDKK